MFQKQGYGVLSIVLKSLNEGAVLETTYSNYIFLTDVPNTHTGVNVSLLYTTAFELRFRCKTAVK